MDWLSVRGDEDERVTLDGELSRTDCRQRVDHTEAVSASRSDGEGFQGSVGLVSSGRVLAKAVSSLIQF